ncbi:MAG: polysaccharide biosynthesis/export family protein [Thermoanaerobaculia bacterium]
MIARLGGSGLVLLLAATAVAQQPSVSSGPPAGAPAVAADASGDYSIGPKDLLDIRVFEIPELNLERRVTDAGTIDLPMLGDFSVEGLTASQIRDKLEKMLTAKYVNRANVSVVVKEYGNKPLAVLGAVQKPGSLNISGRWTLLQAISAAGGLTERAGKTIYVMRRADNGLSDTLEVDVDDLLHGSSSQWNVPLQPGDIVNVEAKRSVRVFCLGAVRSPGALDFDGGDRITLLSVIAKAGGLTDKASSKIRIKRRGSDGKDAEMVVSFGRVVSGKDPDPTLEADDVVIVKESFF